MPHQANHNTDDCSALEPFLTAFFDGEATGAEAEAARAHLDHCASCDRVWRQWQHARDMFKAVPAAPLPASLVGRLRVACRGAEGKTIEPLGDLAAERLLEEALCEAARGLDVDPFTPPLRNFFPEAAPPANLEQKILAATVGVREKDAVIGPPPVNVLLDSMRSVFAPRTLRWGGAFAVPALAVWLIMAANTTEPTVTSEVDSSPEVAENVAPEPLVEDVPVVRNSKPVLPRSSRVATAPLPRKAAPAPNMVADTGVFRNDYLPRAAAWTNDKAPAARLINTSFDEQQAHLDAAEAQAGGVGRIRTTPRLSIKSESRRSVRKIREISVSSAADVLSHAVLATAPMGNIRVAAEDVDATYEAVSHLRDERPEDLSSVVDDYRASLVVADERMAEDEDFDEDELM